MNQYGDALVDELVRETSGIIDWGGFYSRLYNTSYSLGNEYCHSKINIDRDQTFFNNLNSAIDYYEKSLTISKFIQNRLQENKQANSDNEKQSSDNYSCFSAVEGRLSVCQLKLDNNEKAGDHCDNALSFARQVVGEERNTTLYIALVNKTRLLHLQSKYVEAKERISEAYNFMAKVHYPDHPELLQAADRRF
jgi:tetratricopeptide (TPR) repeat protein